MPDTTTDDPTNSRTQATPFAGKPESLRPAGRGDSQTRTDRSGILTHLPVHDVIGGFIFVLAWTVLFAAGLIIDSGGYRAELTSGIGLTLRHKIYDWFVAISCYTLTNVLLLCAISSVIGEFGRRVRLGLTEEAEEIRPSGNPFSAALARGFFIYLVAISGIMMLVENPFTATSPQQYVRLAGFISLLSFMMGYNPHMFGKFFARVSEVLQGRTEREK